MGFDPKKLDEAKSKFDPEKLKAAKAVGSEAGTPEAGEFDFAGSARRTASNIYDKYIKDQIIPTTLSAAAARIPALTLPGRAGLLAAPLVEGAYQGAAGYVGEKANQLLGITPESEGQAMLQGGLQAAPAMFGKAYGMLRPFRGRDGAVLANDLAAKEGRQMIQRYKPTTESSVAFDEAFKEGAEIPMNNTIGVMKDIMAPIGGNRTLSYAYGDAAKDIKVIADEIKKGSLSAKDWQFIHTRLGQTIGSIKGKGRDRAKQLYAAMMTDLEQAAEHEVRPMNTGMTEGMTTPMGQRPIIEPRQQPIQQPGPTIQQIPGDSLPTVPERGGMPSTDVKEPAPATVTKADVDTLDVPGTGAGKLNKALEIYRREKSVEDIGGYIEDAMKSLRGQGADQQFNSAEVIRKLKADRFYEKAFTTAERKDIEQTLHAINTAPALPTPGSINAGSKRMNQRIAGATAGAAAGAYMGGPIGAAVGGTAGFMARDVADMASNLAFALRTKVGREMIKELAKTKGGFHNQRNYAVLSAYTSALRHQPGTEMEQ